jgi:hypothetical protein
MKIDDNRATTITTMLVMASTSFVLSRKWKNRGMLRGR